MSFLVVIGLLIWESCGSLSVSSQEVTYRHVGDIGFDPDIDDSAFVICNPDYIFQYFNNGSGPQYVDEKLALDEYFFSSYKAVELFEENGMIRIRFVVNCEGGADRYRMMEADLDYKEKIFDDRIADQLMDLTKAIPMWPVKTYREGAGDYYMYLIFKIKDGQLIEVMP